MATATVGVSPVRGPRINQNLYVGQAGIRSIQAAVNYAAADGGIFVVVIPFGYNPADLISAVVNGSASIILSDQRGNNGQSYLWSGSAYIPADFRQMSGFSTIGPATAYIDGSVTIDFEPSLNRTKILSRSNNAALGQFEISAATSNADGGFETYIVMDGLTAQIFLPIVASEPVTAPCYYATAEATTLIDGSASLEFEPSLNRTKILSRSNNSALGQFEISAATRNADGGFETYLVMDELTAQIFLPIVASEPVTAPCYIANAPFTSHADGSASLEFEPSLNRTKILSRSNNANLGQFEVSAATSNADGGFKTYLVIDGLTAQIELPVSITGDLSVSGTITAPACAINGSPVRTMANTPNAIPQVYPGAGLGVSTGSAWGTSIDPTTLQGKLTLTTTGTSGAATLVGNTLNIPAYAGGGMVYPGAGLGVSTGSAWGTSIDPTTLQGKLTLTTIGSSGPATLVGTTLNVPAYTAPAQAYPGAGIGVSTGSAWGASIDPATLARLNVVNPGNFACGEGVACFGITPPSANSARVSYTGGAAYYDAMGSSPSNVSSMHFRVCSSDASITIDSMEFDNAGNVHVLGDLSAGTKSFRIPHPLNKKKNLTHGCLEGPEHAVYYRGEATTKKGVATVTLPLYFEALTEAKGRTVQLTVKADGDRFSIQVAAGSVEGGQFKVYSTDPTVTVYWEVKAIRKGAAIEVESDREAA